MGNTLRLGGYLTVTRTRRWPNVRARYTTKIPARLHKGERVIRIVVDIPFALFDDPPRVTVRGTAELPDIGLAEAALQAAGITYTVIEKEPEND